MHRFVCSLMVLGLLAGQTYSAAPEQTPGPLSDKAMQAYRTMCKAPGPTSLRRTSL